MKTTAAAWADEAALVARLRAASQLLEPVPTGEIPTLEPLAGIRAVLFDLYGTLFLSGAGAEPGVNDAALARCLEAAGLPVPGGGMDLASRYRDVIARHHAARRAEGIAHPEVDVREVWAELLADLGIQTDHSSIAALAVEVDALCHPCWPAPGLAAMLTCFHEAGLRLGVISNAQAHTPLLFPALTGRNVEEWGFRKDLQAYSWEGREAKPSVRLFHRLAERLRGTYGIEPEQAAYIGNDVRNDIAPANLAGFHTILFAGDARSLRWRRDDPACGNVKPGRIITALDQLPLIISGR